MFEFIIFMLVLSVLVLVHELGHYLFAKKNKITVKEFGLGYPPRALKLFTYQGTIFSLNWIPFGGFVQMEGEDGPQKDQAEAQTTNGEGPFYQKSMRARLETLLAGVVFNFIFGILAFAIIFSKTGVPVALNQQARIYEVAADSPAAEAGLTPNTNIIAFYSQSDQQLVTVNGISEVQDYVASHLGETVTIKTTGQCEADSCQEIVNEAEVYLRTGAEKAEDQGAMGVIFTDTYYQHYPWYLAPFNGIYYGFKQAVTLGVLILESLFILFRDLILGRGLQMEVAGPVGIVHQAQVYGFFDGGFLSILNFAALLSINLGIMNLLPIPALDGGRAVFVLLEKLFKKQKVEKIANWSNYLGFMILIALMILVSANDVLNLFK